MAAPDRLPRIVRRNVRRPPRQQQRPHHRGKEKQTPPLVSRDPAMTRFASHLATSDHCRRSRGFFSPFFFPPARSRFFLMGEHFVFFLFSAIALYRRLVAETTQNSHGCVVTTQPEGSLQSNLSNTPAAVPRLATELEGYKLRSSHRRRRIRRQRHHHCPATGEKKYASMQVDRVPTTACAES